MITSIYKKIIEFKIDSEESDYIIKRRKLVNYLALIGSSIYILYTIIFLFTNLPLHALINFSACLVTFGSYFILTYLNYKELAKLCVFYLLPFLGFLPFIYLYGNLGTDYYAFPLLIMYVFIEDKKKKLYVYLTFIILFFLAGKLIINYHEVGEEWAILADKFYTPNITFSFILSASFILLFKDEIIKSHNKEKEFSKQLEEKYTEEKKRLKQIEHLSRELNHRVKNNLQIISSLINLKLSKEISKENQSVLKDINNKIISLALVHQKLHKTDTGHTVSLNEYASELIQYILQSFNETKDINTTIEIDVLKISIEDAVHIGLILNELTTNAVKYGKTKEGINLKLTIQQEDNLLKVMFSDDGVGFKDDFKIDDNDSFGLGFIQSMIQSYNGSINIKSKDGATIIITLEIETFQ